MIKISLDNDIANKNDDWLAFWDGESHVFSVDTIKQLLKDNPDEKEITIDIHCESWRRRTMRRFWNFSEYI